MELKNYLMILGGLGIFIYGMKIMSESLEKASGENLKKILSGMTYNRFLGVFSGFLITSIIQSSSATTVMVVSFVNAGLLNLVQAISIILGANIGTTITGWLVNITNLKVDIVEIAFITAFAGMIMMFLKNDKIKTWGSVLLGFSLLFIGLYFLKTAIPKKEITTSNAIYQFFQFFQGRGYASVIIYVLIGTVFTLILQSSSATMAFTITLMNQGYLELTSACGMVLGENIGTTITAVLASIPANRLAKKAALSHTIFNLIGVSWMLLPFIFSRFTHLADFISHHLPAVFKGAEGGTALAVFHTAFNVTNTLLFIGFVPWYAKLIDKLVGQGKKKEDFSLRNLSTGLISTPDIALLEAQKQIHFMATQTFTMFQKTCDLFDDEIGKKQPIVEDIKSFEEKIDKFHTELSSFMISLIKQKVSDKSADEINLMIDESRNWEWISDSCYQISRLYKKAKDSNIDLFYSRNESDIKELEQNLTNFYQLILNNHGKLNNNRYLYEGMQLENNINDLYKKIKKKTVSDIGKKKKKTIASGLHFMEIIREFEHIGDALKYILKAYQS